MATEYYLAVNGQPKGPMTLEEILQENLNPETLVWKTGLPSWIKAAEMPELAPAFEPPIEIVEPEERVWFAMIDGVRRVGPLSASELLTEGLRPDTPVWKGGMPDWQPAQSQEELRKKFENRENKRFSDNPERGQQHNPFANNPQYDHNYYYNRSRQTHDSYRQSGYSQNNYGSNPYGRQDNFNPYNQRNENRYQNGIHTNWLPWAIVATILGFLTSCIGAIFGIIGIVQANKANTLFSQGFEEAGERANNNAKIMTIIGYVFAGIGILATIILKNFYSSFLNIY